MNIDEIIRQMKVNAEAIRALVETISAAQAEWKPTPETWSMKKVMEHVYNEERIDFRKHLREMFAAPPQPWSDFPRNEYIPVDSLRQALDGFLKERVESLAWLAALKSPDWDIFQQATFGPNDVLAMHTGDVLISWVAHDYLHIRQINELLYAWNEKQGAPYSVRYAGGW